MTEPQGASDSEKGTVACSTTKDLTVAQEGVAYLLLDQFLKVSGGMEIGSETEAKSFWSLRKTELPWSSGFGFVYVAMFVSPNPYR